MRARGGCRVRRRERIGCGSLRDRSLVLDLLQSLPAATVATGANGRVQLRMDDGTFLSLPPASQVSLPRAEPRLLELALRDDERAPVRPELRPRVETEACDEKRLVMRIPLSAALWRWRR